jgi:hypothetical protein
MQLENAPSRGRLPARKTGWMDAGPLRRFAMNNHPAPLLNSALKPAARPPPAKRLPGAASIRRDLNLSFIQYNIALGNLPRNAGDERRPVPYTARRARLTIASKKIFPPPIYSSNPTHIRTNNP